MRCLKGLALPSSPFYIVVSIALMYRAMRMQLQPFCTTANCNRSCHQVHRRNQEPSSPSVSVPADFLKTKRNLLRRQNYFFIQGEQNHQQILFKI